MKKIFVKCADCGTGFKAKSLPKPDTFKCKKCGHNKAVKVSG